mgnify:CR=1 FL=1
MSFIERTYPEIVRDVLTNLTQGITGEAHAVEYNDSARPPVVPDIVLLRRPGEPEGMFRLPWIVPAAGLLVCLLMLFHASAQEWKVAGLILLGILLLYAVLRPRQAVVDDVTF